MDNTAPELHLNRTMEAQFGKPCLHANLAHRTAESEQFFVGNLQLVCYYATSCRLAECTQLRGQYQRIHVPPPNTRRPYSLTLQRVLGIHAILIRLP